MDLFLLCPKKTAISTLFMHLSHKECFNENYIHHKFQRYVNVSMSSERYIVEIKQVVNENRHRHVHGDEGVGDEQEH